MALLAAMIAEVASHEDLPIVAMYAFCLFSGWFAMRWLARWQANRLQLEAVATKLEEPNSKSEAGVNSPHAPNRKNPRANAESRKRARKALNKAGVTLHNDAILPVVTRTPTEDGSSKSIAPVAPQQAFGMTVHASTELEIAEINPDANGRRGTAKMSKSRCNLTGAQVVTNNCDAGKIMSQDANEAGGSQVETNVGAAEVEQALESPHTQTERDFINKISPEKAATVMLKPQAHKEHLKLAKKLREVESLKQRLANGHELEPNQLEKIAHENYFHEQVVALQEGEIEVQPGFAGVSLSKVTLQAPVDIPDEGVSSNDPIMCASGKDISDETDGASTRSSDDVQAAGYRLDWNDPFWESAEPPYMRFNSLPEPDEEEDEVEWTEGAPDAAPLDGSFFMPVGFLSQNQEYFPFVEVSTPQTDLFLEPAVMQKVVMEPTIFEPVAYDPLGCQSEYMQDTALIEQPDPGWSPVSSPVDWDKLGKKRGVRLSCNSWSSASSRDVWENEKQSMWAQCDEMSLASPCDSWENQGRRWDEPWGL